MPLRRWTAGLERLPPGMTPFQETTLKEAAWKLPTETQEDENNMLDNDWDTSEWSMQEIESACGTLITECEKNSNIKRQELSMRMLLWLLDRHQEAVNYLTKVSGRSDRERSESEARAKRERSESEARAKKV